MTNLTWRDAAGTKGGSIEILNGEVVVAKAKTISEAMKFIDDTERVHALEGLQIGWFIEEPKTNDPLNAFFGW